MRSPGSRAKSVCTCQCLRPRRAVWALALSRPSVLPSVTRKDVGTRDEGTFAAQWLAYALPCQRFANTLAGICASTRGRCGSLLLHRDGLAPSTPCRSPGALRSSPNQRTLADRSAWSVWCQQRSFRNRVDDCCPHRKRGGASGGAGRNAASHLKRLAFTCSVHRLDLDTRALQVSGCRARLARPTVRGSIFHGIRAVHATGRSAHRHQHG